MAELGAAIPAAAAVQFFSPRSRLRRLHRRWSDWISTCGTAASRRHRHRRIQRPLFPILAGNTKIEIISIGIICGFGILQWRGIRWGSGAQLSTAAMKTGAFFVLVLACFLLGGPAHKAAMQSASFIASFAHGWPLAIAIMLGLQAVIYTVDGWDGVIYFGEEVRNPGRDIRARFSAASFPSWEFICC